MKSVHREPLVLEWFQGLSLDATVSSEVIVHFYSCEGRWFLHTGVFSTTMSVPLSWWIQQRNTVMIESEVVCTCVNGDIEIRCSKIQNSIHTTSEDLGLMAKFVFSFISYNRGYKTSWWDSNNCIMFIDANSCGRWPCPRYCHGRTLNCICEAR